MFLRSSLVVFLLALGCLGGSEKHDQSTPVEAPKGCGSESTPERCKELAAASAKAGKNDLAWAYTVLECQSPLATECPLMWQSYSKLAPTQTDALNLLHDACSRTHAACQLLAAWHRERGHMQVAASYEKHFTSAAALATDLTAIMHGQGAKPRTDPIAQMIGHAPRAPVAAKKQPKAWPTRTASFISSSDTCRAAVMIDRHEVTIDKCVGEVRPIEQDQITLRNRCNVAITVSYAGEGIDHKTYANKIRLEPYEALGLGMAHTQIGELTFASCPNECTATTNPDDVSSPWQGADTLFYCSGPRRGF
jgi:hypothetical protein